MQRDRFSFLEISQDPLLTILALVLVGTVWLILPGGSRAPQVETMARRAAALRAELQSLEDKQRVLEGELQAVTEEKGRLDAVAASARPVSGGPDPKLLDGQIAFLAKQREIRKRELEALEEQLRKAAPGTGPAGQETEAALHVKIQDVKRRIRELEEERVSLERRILAAQQAAASKQGEQARNAAEIARLQNELKAKRQELDKLRADLKAIEGKGTISGDVVFKSNKPKTTNIQLIHNRVFPIDKDHFEVLESGQIEQAGRRYSAQRIGRKAGVAGDDLQRVGLPASSLSKRLKTVDPKDTRVMLLVHGDSFEMLRKAKEIVKGRGFEVGWWPDDRDTFVVSEAPTDERPPSERGRD